MALLPIIQYPDPVLAAKAEPVTEFNDELRKLAADMAETMYAAPGVGLAANQVGSLKRIVVIDITDEKNNLLVLVNPYIKSHTEELAEFEEGCLSLKGLYEKVSRPDGVTVCAQDLDGKPFEIEATGLLAVCLQHELDHRHGLHRPSQPPQEGPRQDEAAQASQERQAGLSLSGAGRVRQDACGSAPR